MTSRLVDGIRQTVLDALQKLRNINQQLNTSAVVTKKASISNWPRLLWHAFCLVSAAIICILILLVASPVLLFLLIQATITTYIVLFFVGARMLVFYLNALIALCFYFTLWVLRRATARITYLIRGNARSKYDYDMVIKADDPFSRFVSIKKAMPSPDPIPKTPPPDRWNRESLTAPPSPENLRSLRKPTFVIPTMTSADIGTRFSNTVDMSPGSTSVVANSTTILNPASSSLGLIPGPGTGVLRTPIGMVEPVTPLQSAHDVMEDYFFTEKGEWKRQMEERAKVRSRAGSIATQRPSTDTSSSK